MAVTQRSQARGRSSKGTEKGEAEEQPSSTSLDLEWDKVRASQTRTNGTKRNKTKRNERQTHTKRETETEAVRNGEERDEIGRLYY